MVYNFKELYLLQKELDHEIHQFHHVDYSNTMSKRALALLVEIGEFANETRCFKYWSLKPSSEREVVLEEYIDGIHFILSLGIAIGIDINSNFATDISNLELVDAFLDSYEAAIKFTKNYDSNDYINLFKSYLSLGEKFGFSYDDIHRIYLKKNAINHQRQNSHY